MIKNIKVLIVDDSLIYRSLVKSSLDHLASIEVVGVASNGRIAIDKLKVMNVDLVILDLEMPEMDGLSTLKEIKRLGIKVKVILFSSLTMHGAAITLEGLNLGASDFITKPNADSQEGSPQERIRGLLLPKIKAMFEVEDNLEKVVPSPVEELVVSKSISSSLWELYRPKIITIASSTGGPSVLETIFQEIKGNLRCPIIIVQHMPPIFTATLAERIQKITGITASEAKDGEELRNQIYVAPGDYHLRLKGSRMKVIMELGQDEQINFVRPAVDPLFATASSIFKEGCLGIVLTGMGQDGCSGSAVIKNNEGVIIIQDEKSCVVFGMPGAVKNQGSFDFIKTPDEIAEVLKSKAIQNY